MKLTGTEVENVFMALQSLQDEKFDIITGSTIADLITKMQTAYVEINQKREEVIHQYADKDENDKVILDDKQRAHIKTDFVEEAQNKLNEIYEKIYEIDAKYLSTEKLKNTTLTLKQITNLKPILD